MQPRGLALARLTKTTISVVLWCIALSAWTLAAWIYVDVHIFSHSQVNLLPLGMQLDWHRRYYLVFEDDSVAVGKITLTETRSGTTTPETKVVPYSKSPQITAGRLLIFKHYFPTHSKFIDVQSLQFLSSNRESVDADQSRVLVSMFTSCVDIKFPQWFALVVITLLPFLWVAPATIRRWFGRQRFANGYCSNCGYDLRASTRRCPECGLAFQSTPTVAITQLSESSTNLVI